MSNGISEINSFLASSSLETTQAIQSAQNRDKVTPSGKVVGATSKKIFNSALGTVSTNPVIAAGVDVATSVLGTVSQSLVNTAIKTVSGAIKPLQSATDTFFMLVALVSTAEVEICMELARGNARAILRALDQKDQLIAEIRAEITALFNAISTVLNTQPFFTDYLAKLIQAFFKIDDADRKFKSVVSILKTKHFYNSVQFEQGFSELEAAEVLILPDRTANSSQIRTGALNEGSNTVAHAKDGLAAAASIPGISANIARKMVAYAELTLKINGLISLFLVALTDFIAAYKRNDNVDQATINHITSGTDRLDSLLSRMKVILFPTDGSNKNALYPARVTTAATSWGMELAGIIEWLRVQPGKASKQLDLTGQSVQKYNQAIALLQTFDSRTVETATLKATDSQEDVLDTGKQVVKALFDANVVLATSRDPSSIKLELKKLLNLFEAARRFDADIRNALLPFVNSHNNLIAGAAQVINNLTSIADKLGFDRAGDFIRSGNVNGLFSINADTSTYVGAAVVGIRGVISTVNASPNGTDQDRAKLEAINSDLSRQNSVKKVEASRGATNTTDAFVAAKTAEQDKINQDGNSATQIAAKYGAQGTAAQPASEQIKGLLKQVTGNTFGFLS